MEFGAIFSLACNLIAFPLLIISTTTVKNIKVVIDVFVVHGKDVFIRHLAYKNTHKYPSACMYNKLFEIRIIIW